MMKRNSRHSTDSLDYGVSHSSACTAIIGSMTMAMKAQSALADAAIRVNIAKISSNETQNGCAYGVDFPCTQSSNVRTILSHAGIRVRKYLGG